jgi:hypothetical protein
MILMKNKSSITNIYSIIPSRNVTFKSDSKKLTNLNTRAIKVFYIEFFYTLPNNCNSVSRVWQRPMNKITSNNPEEKIDNWYRKLISLESLKSFVKCTSRFRQAWQVCVCVCVRARSCHQQQVYRTALCWDAMVPNTQQV